MLVIYFSLSTAFTYFPSSKCKQPVNEIEYYGHNKCKNIHYSTVISNHVYPEVKSVIFFPFDVLFYHSCIDIEDK